MKNKDINIDDQIEDYIHHFMYEYCSCEAGEIAQDITKLDGTYLINDEIIKKSQGKQTAIMAYKKCFKFCTYSPDNQNTSNVKRNILIRKKVS